MQKGTILISLRNSTGKTAHRQFFSLYSFLLKDTQRLLSFSKCAMSPFLSGVAARISSCLSNTYSLFLSYYTVSCDTILVSDVNRRHRVRLSRMFQRKTQLVDYSRSSLFILSLALIMDMGAGCSCFLSTIKKMNTSTSESLSF